VACLVIGTGLRNIGIDYHYRYFQNSAETSSYISSVTCSLHSAPDAAGASADLFPLSIRRAAGGAIVGIQPQSHISV